MGQRGGWYYALYAAGYIGSVFTVIYTWRLIFRTFWGEPCEQARELEHGHLYHAPHPFNPANGEVEDTEVGFPGADHHIAEQTWQMKAAMAVLAFLSIVAHPANDALEWFGLILTSVIAVAGIAFSYSVWVTNPGASARWQQRFAPLHRLFVNTWYFDELIDTVIVRPFAAFGRWARDTFERIVVDGVLVGGTSGVVKSGSAAVRGLQTGLLRSYAGLVVAGLFGVVLYFLIRAA